MCPHAPQIKTLSFPAFSNSSGRWLLYKEHARISNVLHWRECIFLFPFYNFLEVPSLHFILPAERKAWCLITVREAGTLDGICKLHNRLSSNAGWFFHGRKFQGISSAPTLAADSIPAQFLTERSSYYIHKHICMIFNDSLLQSPSSWPPIPKQIRVLLPGSPNRKPHCRLWDHTCRSVTLLEPVHCNWDHCPFHGLLLWTWGRLWGGCDRIETLNW